MTPEEPLSYLPTGAIYGNRHLSVSMISFFNSKTPTSSEGVVLITVEVKMVGATQPSISPILLVHKEPKMFVNIKELEKLLSYKFEDPSLVVEVQTHGSYQMSDVARSYQIYLAIWTARVIELRRSLQTMRRGNQQCGSYFEKMRSIADDQLASVGEPVSDTDLVQYILSALGSEFNSFVIAITTRYSPVSLIELHSFLVP